MKKLLFIISFLFFSYIQANNFSSDFYYEKLLEINDDLNSNFQILSNENLKFFLSYFDKSNSANYENRTILSLSLTIYAKLNFYGLISDQGINLKKAFYYFKLANRLGSSQSKHYISIYNFFEFDTLYFQENLNEFSSIFSEKQYSQIQNYLKERKYSLSFIESYFSAIDKYPEAILSIAYKYTKGIGTAYNCPSASLYYHEINKNLYVEENQKIFIPKFLEKKKLTEELFDEENEIISLSFENAEERDELEFLKMKANLNNIEAITKLAYYYYYGLKGIKKNLEISFDYFSQAAFLGDTAAKASVGYMYLKGLGVKKNFKLAYQEFNEAALKKDPRGKYGLGLLYINGLGVEKNEKIALKYFKESADSGNAEGQYLYGSYLLVSKDYEKQGFKNEAHNYITLAAHQGHAGAMYALGLMHLDGSELYYSCDLSLRLFRSSAERGVWGEKNKEAYIYLKKNNKKLAFLLYLELSYMGFQNAQVNSGLILDKFNILSHEDFDYSSLEEELNSDRVFQKLKNFEILKPLIANSIYSLLYDDLYEIFSANLKNKEIDWVFSILARNNNTLINPNKQISKLLFELGVNEGESFSALRLGDYYYYGLINEINYEKAAYYYKKVIEFNNEEIFIAQAYFNLAYMHQYGLGVEKDLNKSGKYYNKTYETNKLSWISVTIAEILLYFESRFITDDIYHSFGFFIIHDIISKFIGSKIFHLIMISSILMGLLGLLTFRLRLKNYIESFYLKSD